MSRGAPSRRADTELAALCNRYQGALDALLVGDASSVLPLDSKTVKARATELKEIRDEMGNTESDRASIRHGNHDVHRTSLIPLEARPQARRDTPGVPGMEDNAVTH
jgi:hypothetical protein